MQLAVAIGNSAESYLCVLSQKPIDASLKVHRVLALCTQVKYLLDLPLYQTD